MADTEPSLNEFEVPGPNLFVDNRRRRVPGVSYVVIGVAAVIVSLVRAPHDPVLVNVGVTVAGVLLIVVGVYSFIAGIGLDVDEEEALRLAAAAVPHPMGHAAAQMGWRGWMSRPTWRILWYSAEDPPHHRGLVLVDGHDGRVLDTVIETNPEVGSAIDWSLGDDSSTDTR